MLLLIFSGIQAGPPPSGEPFFAVGGRGLRAQPGSLSEARDRAQLIAAMELQQAAERDERDLREVQELITALFAFKGIF